MSNILQLKYVMSSSAKSEGMERIGLQELQPHGEYENFWSMPGLLSDVQDSLVVTAVARKDPSKLFDNTLTTRYVMSAFNSAFGLDETMENARYLSKYYASNREHTTNRYKDTSINAEYYTHGELSSFFLPTLIAKGSNGNRAYDLLGEYVALSQLNYSPLHSPMYMKKYQVRTYIGRDIYQKYRIAWEEVNNGSSGLGNVMSNMGVNTLNHQFLSEFYAPSLVYDTNVFSTVGAIAGVNSSETDNSRFALTLKLNGADSLRGVSINGMNFNLIREAKRNYSHKDDIIGFANFQLPFNMYLNHLTHYKITNELTYNGVNTDVIKIRGIGNDSDGIKGVKLVIDGEQLVDQSSIIGGKLIESGNNANSGAGSSKLQVSEPWLASRVLAIQSEGQVIEYALMGGEAIASTNTEEDNLTLNTENPSGSITRSSFDIANNALNTSISNGTIAEATQAISSAIANDRKDNLQLISGGLVNKENLKSDKKSGSLLYSNNTVSLTTETSNMETPPKVELVSTKVGKDEFGLYTPTVGEVEIRNGFDGEVYISNGNDNTPQHKRFSNGSYIRLYEEEKGLKTNEKIELVAGNTYDQFYLSETVATNKSTIDRSNKTGRIELKAVVKPEEGDTGVKYSSISIGDDIIINSNNATGLKFVFKKDGFYYYVTLFDILNELMNNNENFKLKIFTPDFNDMSGNLSGFNDVGGMENDNDDLVNKFHSLQPQS